jgi:hypothetical protein
MNKKETKALLRNKKLIEVDGYVKGLTLNNFYFECEEIKDVETFTKPKGYFLNINFYIREKDFEAINKILTENKGYIVLGINDE